MSKVKLTVIPEGHVFTAPLLVGGTYVQLTAGTPVILLKSTLRPDWRPVVDALKFSRPDGSSSRGIDVEDPYEGNEPALGEVVETEEPEPQPESEEDEEEEEESGDDLADSETPADLEQQILDHADQLNIDPVAPAEAVASPDDLGVQLNVETADGDQELDQEDQDAPEGADSTTATVESEGGEAPVVQEDPAPADQVEESAEPEAPVDEAPVDSQPVDESPEVQETVHTQESLEGLEMTDLREVGKTFNVKDSSKAGLIEKILAAQAALKEGE